jgi:N-acetyl-gamma-glutamyl-phosphate reductase common form
MIVPADPLVPGVSLRYPRAIVGVRVGIVGARGYVGKELVELVNAHRELDLALSVSARDQLSPDDVAKSELDAYALALPNGATKAYVDAIRRVRPDAVLVDLSADHRFDDGWVYGQPERLREQIRKARAIANPGCYATAAQLALAPLVPLLADGAVPTVFGVSGYSGAGTTPSPKNDPEVLKDNLYPYTLVGHVHEREVSRQLGRPIFLLPHVAPFFRGLTVTVSVVFARPEDKGTLTERYREAYGGEPLVHLSSDPPLVRDIMGKHHVAIGGLAVSEDGRHAAVVATIDNLLGGAATQAIRNLNLALGLPERAGLPETSIDAATR